MHTHTPHVIIVRIGCMPYLAKDAPSRYPCIPNFVEYKRGKMRHREVK